MPLLTMKQILDDAIAKNYGVGAFNINNMEQTLAIMSAADRTESPVILQASRGARKYAGPVMIYGLVQAAMKLLITATTSRRANNPWTMAGHQ